MDNNTVNDAGKSFLKKLIGFSAATWISFALSFISSPINTRLFAPEEMGKINLFTTYLNMFLMFAYLGLDQAYVRFFYKPPDSISKQKLFTTCLLMSELVAGILSIGIFLFWSPLSVAISWTQSLIIAAFFSVSLIANIVIR